ncbi:MAG: glycosyltransferase family 4 protein [Candidatus Omnitrophica bacterium]|nr:glycosyltransferase family 4 protein [Candidatus Omnitrophota bacterium]
MPRVVFITREGSSLPGARIRCYSFAKALARHGVQADVLSYADTLGAKDGAQEHEMSLAEKIRLNARAYRWLKNLDRRTVLIISRCHYHSFAPILYHLKSRQPMILDLDDWEMREDPQYRWGWYPTSKAHWLIRWMAKRSVACLAASRHLEEFLRPWNRNVLYLPTGVDTDLFTPRSQPSDELVKYAWIGTFHHRQYVEDIRFLLECFSQVKNRLPNAQLEIVGDGLYREQILEAIEQFDSERVVWRGWIQPDQIPEYLDTVHVGLYPVAQKNQFTLSKSPTKLFEYMAMGKAVVVSQIGEVEHVIRHGENGLVAKNKLDFSETMLCIGENLLLGRRFGQAAVQRIEEHYSLSKLAEKLLNLIYVSCY